MSKDKLVKLPPMELLNPEQEDILKDLTERQKDIARMKLRGFPQKTIAKVCNITPARVSQEVKAIREHFQAKGSNINQSEVVGETTTLFEEIERRAWEVFFTDESKKLRALDTIMAAREKYLKLLMDLGLIKRTAVEHTHDVLVSPVMASLTTEKRQAIVATVMATKPGEEPEPPTDEDNEDITDGYFEEFDDDKEDD